MIGSTRPNSPSAPGHPQGADQLTTRPATAGLRDLRDAPRGETCARSRSIDGSTLHNAELPPAIFTMTAQRQISFVQRLVELRKEHELTTYPHPPEVFCPRQPDALAEPRCTGTTASGSWTAPSFRVPRARPRAGMARCGAASRHGEHEARFGRRASRAQARETVRAEHDDRVRRVRAGHHAVETGTLQQACGKSEGTDRPVVGLQVYV